jgi:hypothetical protein
MPSWLQLNILHDGPAAFGVQRAAVAAAEAGERSVDGRITFPRLNQADG